MSRGSKSNYPFRPDRRGKPKSSDNSSGRQAGRIAPFLEQPRAKNENITFSGQASFGHTNPALERFLAQNRHHAVPIRAWGGGITYA